MQQSATRTTRSRLLSINITYYGTIISVVMCDLFSVPFFLFFHLVSNHLHQYLRSNAVFLTVQWEIKQKRFNHKWIFFSLHSIEIH